MIKKMLSIITGCGASLIYFFLINSYVVEIEISQGGLVSHMIGGSNPWLAVYAFDQRDSVFQLLFGGNEGIWLNWYLGIQMLVKTVFLGIMIGFGVKLLLNFCTERWLKNKKEL